MARMFNDSTAGLAQPVKVIKKANADAHIAFLMVHLLFFIILPLPRSVNEAVEKHYKEIKSIPGLADCLHRIEETGRGVEQEIIDYR